MNNMEITISKIRSYADRFDALSIHINDENSLTDNFISKMLLDKYYVNRAEILDYIISYRISDRFEKELFTLLKTEKSLLNFGRLRVCVALSSSVRLHKLLHKQKSWVGSYTDSQQGYFLSSNSKYKPSNTIAAITSKTNIRRIINTIRPFLNIT